MGALDAPAAARLMPIASNEPRPASLATARRLAIVLFAGFWCHSSPFHLSLYIIKQAGDRTLRIAACSCCRMRSRQTP